MFKKILLSVALLSSFAISELATASTVNLVNNGGFEAEQISGAYNDNANVPGWTSTGVFEIQKGSNTGGLNFFNTSYEGNQYLELNSTSLTTISQTLNTVVGSTYDLSFAYSGRSDTPSGLSSMMNVFWNGVLVSPTLTAAANSGWQIYDFTGLTATGGATVLSFASVGPTGAPTHGSYLDGINVSVSAVPEPSTYLMMFLGLGLIAFAVKKRDLKV